ncbi:MAG: exodeoxyribonuclease VII small subunit [Deltaproteobacteria bacterium]|nr:exodeoxyribonuclease VII small subunit [Deltaproteobacteria bacterium]
MASKSSAGHPHPGSAAGTEPPSFEAALAQLESVVVKLERGELSLEESLTAYEDGVRLVQAAKARLDGMQSRLEQLLHDGKTGPLEKAASSDKAT